MSLERLLPTARALAGRAEGMSNAEFAKAANLTASSAGAYISSYVRQQVIYKGHPQGKHPRYFGTQGEAEQYRAGPKPTALSGASPDVVACAAVAQMRQGQVRSSVNLAEICHVHVDVIDLALAPLVDAKKLIRVNVQRSGVTMFDYRLSAAWTPKASDFEICRGEGATPTASVSPVAPPPAPKAPPPPARQAVAPAPTAQSARVASTAVEPAKPAAAPVALAKTEQPAPAPAKAVSTAVAAPVIPTLNKWLRACGSLGFEVAADEVSAEDVDEPHQVSPADVVCALNSRGELAIDIGEGGVLRFDAKGALVIKRFLENTSVLEELAARGAL